LLMNLVGNAIKFTESGSVTLRAAIDPESPEPRLSIDVEDTGIGIAPENLGRIFSPFDQADNSITRRFGGTGLGLAISRRIAQGLGGDISVESEPGRGSRFRATLATGPLDGVPLLSPGLSEALTPPHGSNGAQRAQVDLSGLRVLLVEDGETNRDLISLVLSGAGATVICAENGKEGVAAANRQPFDAILMDMQMPVMDGYTAAHTLRSGGHRLPIIALTAHAMRGDREKCLAAGCTGYLTKPIQIEQLLAAVAEATAGRKEPRDTPANGHPAVPGLESPSPIVSTLPAGEKFQRIVERFGVTLSERLSAMQAACERSDWTELAQQAHWLKGTGGTVGFACFTEPAARLEQAAKQGDVSEAMRRLQEVQSLSERIAVPAMA
jgi:CheY-like chemotaxis protein/HPt (histidine-containing phosphotransfer) domain-containing protein